MAKMSSWTESCLLFVLKAAGVFFRWLPFSLSKAIARMVGRMGYYFLPKKRRVVYGNLKTVYAGTKTPHELEALTKLVFQNLSQSFMEFMYLPKIKAVGAEKFVSWADKEYFDRAALKGKGVIFLAVHSGNWELASVIGSLCGRPYNVVANEQDKTPKLNRLLNEYRRITGAQVIKPGSTTRDIIRALQNNEVVSLVFDQGGRDGMVLDFLGKPASLSTGAIRLAIRLGTPVCPVWMSRQTNGHQILRVFPPLEFDDRESAEQKLKSGMQQAARLFEKLIYDYPDEYLWFYKLFKYSSETRVLILDDGKTGHLRQSQSVAQTLKSVLGEHDKIMVDKTIQVQFQSPARAKLFRLYVFLTQKLDLFYREDVLKFFLSESAYQQTVQFRADFCVSCGSSVAGVNFFLKRCYGSKSICLLKPSMVGLEHFDAVILPRHDRARSQHKSRVVFTRAALNLVSPEYLKQQSALLLNRYSHLKGRVRIKIGILLGGDTKNLAFDENLIRTLVRKVKEAAVHYNADILITTSRRTSPVIDALVAREMRNFERCALCIIANEYNVPEAVGGILGLSDVLIVSGESISMVSEAVCSGKRTIVVRPSGDYHSNGALNKYDRFVLGLNEAGYLLASSIKDVSVALGHMMSNKFVFQSLEDASCVRQALEELL